MASYSLAVLNTIRDNASTEYQDRIPVATRDNLETIGRTLTEYKELLNEFTGTLIGKIGLTLFSDKMYSNKLAKFKKGELLAASDVEEIFVEMVSGVAFDPTGANPLGRRKPDNVNVLYYRQNFQEDYEVSVSDPQVKMAFRSMNGVQDLLTSLVNAMYSGAAYDEYVNMKELLAKYGETVNGTFTPYYFDYEVSPVVDEATARSFVKTVRKASADISYVSTQFNHAGVKTFTPKESQVLFVHKDILAHVDIDVLAKAFNMGKTDFEPTIVEVDNFGSLTDTYAILADKDIYRVFDTLRDMEGQRNAKGMFTNYFLHIWQIHAMCYFKNAVRFKKKV